MREPQIAVLDIGRRLEVTHWPGAPGRVPLLLCSGIGSSSSLFDALIEHLDPARPLIAVNPPGLGASPAPKAPYVMHTLARSLRLTMDQLGYDRADILGISWGGVLAQQFAFQNPRRCRRVVLVATSTGWLGFPPRLRTLVRMATPRRHRDPAYARQIAGDLYGGSARADPGGVVDLLHSAPSATPVRSYLYQLGAGTGWTSVPALRMVRQPCLVLAGDDDPIIRTTNARVMARLLPNARLHLYPGGHLALLSHAAELAPVFERFLDEE
ncbi:alpha/beta fold hydrolase [Sporichthya sp.]|uniref:alpha/beta fold hydrolase n=1 Tax=Sporichthya sp. TaxID=65475 RepID=UPI0017CA8D0F|nr:alpha/beta fold hydrolase [Sporichthya sp.]MBA3745279.1 alpha/beta fold hydrolase [Sporichthya sp.]